MKRQDGKWCGFAMAILFFIFLSSLAFGKTVVSWLPEGVSRSLERGDSSTIEVKFICEKKFRDVDLWLVPELRSHVRIDPNHFPDIIPGHEYAVQLTFEASCDEIPSSYEGTLHFRVGERSYADNLKISMITVNPQGVIPHTVQFRSINPGVAYLEEDTTVRTSVYIAPDPYLEITEVKLFRLDEFGSIIAQLGRMYDDGSHGDFLAGDHIFTGEAIFNETIPGPIRLCVSAFFIDAPCPIYSTLFSLQAFVRSDPEKVRSEIASDLKQGNIQKVKQRFVQDKRIHILNGLDAETCSRLADWIKNAQVVKAKENYRIYVGEFLNKKGNKTSDKFTMSRNEVGEWIISSW